MSTRGTQDTYQEFRVIILEDLRSLAGRCFGIGITTSESNTLVVCGYNIRKLEEKRRESGEVTVDLNHRIDIHEVDQSDATLHELDTPPRGTPLLSIRSKGLKQQTTAPDELGDIGKDSSDVLVAPIDVVALRKLRLDHGGRQGEPTLLAVRPCPFQRRDRPTRKGLEGTPRWRPHRS